MGSRKGGIVRVCVCGLFTEEIYEMNRGYVSSSGRDRVIIEIIMRKRGSKEADIYR